MIEIMNALTEAQQDHVLGSAQIAQIIRGLVHDMNNPLGTIRLHAECAMASLDGGGGGESAFCSEIRESLALIDASVDRAQRLTRALRSLARAMSAPTDPRSLASLEEIAGRVVASFKKPLARDGIGIALVCEGRMPKVRVSASQIEDAIGHIVTSAAESLAGAERREILVELGASGGKATCAVRGSGHGPANAPSSSFDPLAGRSELGLPLARAILRVHGGDVERDASRDSALILWIPVDV